MENAIVAPVASKDDAEVSLRTKRTILGQVMKWTSYDGKHSVDYKFRPKFNGEADVDYKLYIHGIGQKIGDAAAKPCDKETGESHPIGLKFIAMKRVRDNLVAGIWNEKREPAVDLDATLLFAALVKLYGGKRSEASIQKYLDERTPAQIVALKVDKKVKPFYDKALAEFVKDVDTSSMLDDLENME